MISPRFGSVFAIASPQKSKRLLKPSGAIG